MLDIFPIADLAAVLWFIAVVGGYEVASRLPRFYDHSIAAAVQKQREAWMLMMSQRDNRIVDGQLIGWLVNANAFFASTSVITIGGLAALLGYSDKAQSILETIPYAAKASVQLWEVKVIFLMAIMTFAFFKFAWAFRLSHYTVMMIGATPEHNSADAAARHSHARRAARLLGLVGEHSNYGLRSFYYTIAGLMWFYHPLAFMAAASWVVLILARRDYSSRSRTLLRGDHPLPEK